MPIAELIPAPLVRRRARIWLSCQPGWPATCSAAPRPPPLHAHVRVHTHTHTHVRANTLPHSQVAHVEVLARFYISRHEYAKAAQVGRRRSCTPCMYTPRPASGAAPAAAARLRGCWHGQGGRDGGSGCRQDPLPRHAQGVNSPAPYPTLHGPPPTHTHTHLPPHPHPPPRCTSCWPTAPAGQASRPSAWSGARSTIRPRCCRCVWGGAGWACTRRCLQRCGWSRVWESPIPCVTLFEQACVLLFVLLVRCRLGHARRPCRPSPTQAGRQPGPARWLPSVHEWGRASRENNTLAARPTWARRDALPAHPYALLCHPVTCATSAGQGQRSVWQTANPCHCFAAPDPAPVARVGQVQSRGCAVRVACSQPTLAPGRIPPQLPPTPPHPHTTHTHTHTHGVPLTHPGQVVW